MARGQKKKATLDDTNADGGATTGYETELWAMADALRGSMDAAEDRDEYIALIADTYHVWRGGEDTDSYSDKPGFCKSASLDEVRKYGYVLTPGRYVGAEPQEEDGEPFEEKMTRLVAELQAQQTEGARLDATIAENLKALGFGGSKA